jgi:dienelactone hydrolase
MKKGILIGLLIVLCGYQLSAQHPEDIYKKPLETVLKEIEQRYHVKLQYETKNTKDKVVNYADWRFRTSIKETLDNVLKPLDMVWQEKDNNTYQIKRYEYFRKDYAEGKEQLDSLLQLYPDVADWEARKKMLKECMLEAMDINLFAKRNDLRPIFRSKRQMDGYTIENVAIESIPGYFLCGTLYRPNGKGPYPVILSPHGHFYNSVDKSIPDERGRYRPDMQYRCAALAKMGAIVFNYDMYSYGESVSQTGNKSYHRTGFAMTMQTWNSIRALDFLLSLPGADEKRVGITGASGGGTQTFLAAALDDRITASCPVAMVSASFFGGCPCESGLPIHACGSTNNAEIAAMIAPKAQLLVTNGNDWTQTSPSIELPYLKKVYSLYKKSENIENAHLANDHHDYAFTKRVPMYYFFAKQFGLNIKAICDKNGDIDESKITIEKSDNQLVFNKEFPMPSHALKSHKAIMGAYKSLQNDLNQH